MSRVSGSHPANYITPITSDYDQLHHFNEQMAAAFITCTNNMPLALPIKCFDNMTSRLTRKQKIHTCKQFMCWSLAT